MLTPSGRIACRLLRLGCGLLRLAPCGGLLGRLLRRLLRLTAPSRAVALRLRCGLLRGLLTPCPAALRLLRLLGGLLLAAGVLVVPLLMERR